ncbi:MAG: MFS transporter [Rhodospirillales bacterium 70-18]|nr:MFS transporter [Rhodospirillales bacterium]OJY73123.1 MAG: MFS transporter [Rhodospirillales bacterium 70-18]
MYAHVLAPWLTRRGIHYGWVMAAITFVTALSTSAAMGMPGVLLTPLRQEFGWDTTDISGPLALRLLLYGLMAPFAAALIQRYGVTRVVAVAVGLIVAGVALATQMTALWELWVTWGVMLGIATGMTALVLGATVSSRWFTARRGLVLGMLTAANATGQLLFLPLAAWLAEHAGWRYALLPATAACFVALVLMVLFAADHPGSLGLAPYGETTVTPPPARTTHGAVRTSFTALADASGSRVFWALFFTFFVCGLSTNGLVQTHFIPLCLDMGLAQVQAASMLAMMGAFDFVGTILSGWLSDRYDNRWLLFWYYGLRGLSLMFLPYSGFTLLGLSIFAVFYGLDWIATVPPTVRLTAQGFGRERAALVFGWVFTAHQLGAATAAFGGGLSRDVLSSYLPAFFAAGVACLLAAIAILGVRRPAAVRVAAAE